MPRTTRTSTRHLLGASLACAGALAIVPSGASAQTYYDDVRPVLLENCVGCHSEDGIAWSMEDAAATFERARRISRAIDLRRMPPFLAEPGHQQYMGDLSLPEETVAMVRAWAEAGHPMGDPRPDPERRMERLAGLAHAEPFAGDVSLDLLPAGEAYLPNQENPDDYRCFLVDWTGTTEEYITGFRAVPGNENVAHHVVVHYVEPDMWDRYRELDDLEEGPGWTCFGGAMPDELFRRSTRAAYEARYPDGLRELDEGQWWLAHWAPGMDGHVFPAGTGIRVRPGAGLVVQMHYYSREAPGESDAGTRMDFMTAPSVERPAMHLAQTRNDWLGSADNESMVIPPGETRSYQMRNNLGDLTSYIARTTGVDEARVRGLEIHSANLHMHAFGHSGDITLQHPTGEVETLLNVPRWDLRWQRDFTFVQPKMFTREDLEDTYLGVRCTYRNTTDEIVYGGFGSFDEMCFNFSYIAVQEGEPVATDPPGGN